MIRRWAGIILVTAVVIGCAPTPPLDEAAVSAYRQVKHARAEQLHSAAYLIDVRINDQGNKYSVTTELYVAGDSVGFYGRGYLGRGAFKGRIIDDTATIYFEREQEYFSAGADQLRSDADCARPGEVVLYLMSLLSGRDDASSEKKVNRSGRRLADSLGRFLRTVELTGDKYQLPKSEMLVDSTCRDSITISYDSRGSSFPYYQPRSILYRNDRYDFRVKGFVREQRYNVPLSPAKFQLIIPPTAARVDSL